MPKMDKNIPKTERDRYVDLVDDVPSFILSPRRREYRLGAFVGSVRVKKFRIKLAYMRQKKTNQLKKKN